MRLHSLVVTAFGPFAGTESVDFDELAAAGLFLFTGPTGAGKTSILDAVCFALYGQVPGARAQGAGRSSLRSDHAGAGVAPEVVLEATLRGRRLRISRSPAWERPKRRGEGTVTEQSRVVVSELTGGAWTTQTTRLDEAGLFLGELLGLTLQQFCQVVLLPQGQFAEFLRADADRRRALLETLFDTRRFSDVEEWLVARRKETARELGDLDDGYRQLLARVAEAAGEAPAEGVTDRLDDGEVAGWVDDLLERALATAGSTGEAAKSAALVAQQRHDAVKAAQRADELRARASALEAGQASLAAAQPARDAAAAELEEARRVAPLLPVLAEAGRLQKELEAVRAEADQAHRGLATVLAPTGTAGSGASWVVASGGIGTAADRPTSGASARRAGAAAAFPALSLVRQVFRSTTDEAATLSLLAEQEAEAERLSRHADALQRTVVELGAKAAKADAWLGTAPERRRDLEAARDDARRAAAELPATSSAAQVAAERLAAGVRRDELAGELGSARDTLRGLVDRHQEAREHLQELRGRRLAGMAAELAAGLAPNQDCPVCGSTEHPRPARNEGAAVTPAAEQSAEAIMAAAEAARQAGERAAAALELALAEQGALSGETPVDALRTEAATAARHLERARATAALVPSADRAFDDFLAEHERWERDKVAHETEQRSAAAQAVEQRATAERLTTELAVARGDDPTIEARRARLERTARDLEGLARHLSDLDRLERAVEEAVARVETAVSERGLRGVEDVAGAMRDDDRVHELEDLVRSHDAEVAAVAQQLADPEVAGAQAMPADDVAARRAALVEAEAARDLAVAAAHAAAARVRRLVQRADEVAATGAARRPIVERHRLVDGLARLAEGKSADNTLRMSLSAYVLAARLEQVAASASDRLLRMTSGRYSLVHTAVAAGGRARGGLTLRVLDSWTGRLRDPASLSGGETFSASLALALGLAEVVAAEAGGALLETLFVDEGFGSLDEDTLDDVMGVLDDLREGGRTVGIVSHVADLRQRVPVQLRVDRGRAGSTIVQ